MHYANWIFMSVLFFIVPTVGFAGSLTDPGAPDNDASAMYTLEDIYNRLNSNTQATQRSGAFTEPSAGPGSTGHTLDQVYEKAIPTQVPKTGQTPTVPANPAPPGSDGDLGKGVSWPSPRFTDNDNGTVTDNLTGLVWLKNSNCTDTVGGVDKSSGRLIWADALTWCNNLKDGSCNLTDSSVVGQWRLPNVMELLSLIDWRYFGPALSNAAGTGQWIAGDAFIGVQSADYWSSTSGSLDGRWGVRLTNGYINTSSAANSYRVWAVRGGQ